MKIAICGKDKDSLQDAPFNDPSWTIWSLNVGGFDDIPRFDKWFDLHELNENGYPYYVRKETSFYARFLKENHHKLVLQAISDKLPGATKFPIEEIAQKYQSLFFNFSVPYMIAYAMYLGAEEIGLYGIRCPQEQYARQETCVAYWIGRAQQEGIKIKISKHSNILKIDEMYAYNLCLDLEKQFM